MLRWFASSQIRNVACLGGNLVTASPISDMNPLLASMGATLVLSKLGEDNKSVSRRMVPVSQFFLGYRIVDISSTEMVEGVRVPVLAKVFEYVKPFKQARRREDDISIVTSGMHIRLAPKEGGFTIEHIAMAFGGMAPTTILAVETAKMMTGADFSQETFKKAEECLLNEMKLPESVPGGQAAYRMTLAASFLYKFYISAVQELKTDIAAIEADPASFPSISQPLPPPPKLDDDEVSGSSNFLSAEKPSFSGVQIYPAPKVAQGLEEKILPKVDRAKGKGADAVGQGTVHQSGALHCTGEALYTDDIPRPPGTLEASLILSLECGGLMESIDVKASLAVPGVVGAFTAEDISKLGGKNAWGPIVYDEFVFLPIGERVSMVGQVLGVVVGETLECAEMGVRAAVVEYSPTDTKTVISIEDAIAANSYYESTRHALQTGDQGVVDALKTTADTHAKPQVGDIVKVSGSFHTGAQEHFYLETNTSLVVPSESDTNLTVYCSTQATTKTQKFCASSTGTPAAKVVVRVKRMGGGFGGKETRSVGASCAAAVAAKRTSRPVRLTLPRNVECVSTLWH
jgi:xanthine dehydrogenase/oxidase